jgi:enoyl-[acyl-carrier protein] reductase II
MKGLVPVRLLKNKFYEQIRDLEARGASSEELTLALGKGRAKRGMLEGDLDEGELEIGQVASLIKDIPTCSELVARIISEYNECITQLKPLS